MWSEAQGPFKPILGPDAIGASAGALGKLGAYVGTWPIPIGGGTFKHSAIAIKYPNNPVTFIEFRGWERFSDVVNGLKSSLVIGNSPLYGAVTDYTWTYVALPSEIGRIKQAINGINGGYIGQRYHLADSSRIIKDVLDVTGLVLSDGQKTVLDNAPGLTTWFFP